MALNLIMERKNGKTYRAFPPSTPSATLPRRNRCSRTIAGHRIAITLHRHTKQQALPIEVAQEPIPELHRTQTMVDKKFHTDGMTMRDIAKITRDKYYSNIINFLGTMAEPRACTLRDNVHMPKLSEDAYSMDIKCYDWNDHFGGFVFRNGGVECILGKQGPNQYDAELSDRMGCTVMSMREIKVTLLGNCTNRSEVSSPKNPFRTPIRTRRPFAYLNSRYDVPAGDYFVVCIPMTMHEQKLVKMFRRHSEAKIESFVFDEILPINAETFGALHFHRVSNVEKLKVYYGGTMRHEGKGHAWTFGMLLTNLDVAYANLWRNKLVYRKPSWWSGALSRAHRDGPETTLPRPRL